VRSGRALRPRIEEIPPRPSPRPRRHEGRPWFCNWIDRQVVAVGLDGAPEVVLTRDPDSYPMGWSIDWPPDGRLLATRAVADAFGGFSAGRPTGGRFGNRCSPRRRSCLPRVGRWARD